MPVPVHELATTEQYLAVLDGHATAFPPGERFAYCNGGYVVLALIAERASGAPFHELVRRRVCEPAGMSDTEFLRSDELPGSAALGYLTVDGSRTNVFHLPVRGSGDGGIYSTAADLQRLVERVLRRADRVEGLGGRDGAASQRRACESRCATASASGSMRRATSWMLHGYDAGVSFRSTHDPASRTTCTVISNTTEGTWPIESLLDELVTP